MNKKVVVAGHICIDITPAFPEQNIENIGDVFKPGKLLQVGKAATSTGGAVANTGLAMKLLGADVTLMGKIGEDEFGDMILKILDKHDSSKGMIRSKDVSTSYSVILAIPGIDRIFLHNPGANNCFHVDDIKDEMLKDVSLFHFGYPTLMKSMYENEGAELISLFKKVKEKNIATSLDLSAIDPNSESGKVDWYKIIKGVMPYVDFFVPSVEELCFILDRDKFDEWQKRAAGRDITEILSLEEDIKPLALKCMQLGTKALLLKCGALGMYFVSADKKTLEDVGKNIELDTNKWANLSIFEMSYIPEKVLSGTGAGDTCIAAFLTSVLNGEEPEMCLHLAAATGASCVEAYDALGGLKPFDDLKNKIEAGWQKAYCFR